MVVWKPDWKSLFMVQNIGYLNGLPSHMTIWLPDTHTVRYSGVRYSVGYYKLVFCQITSTRRRAARRSGHVTGLQSAAILKPHHQKRGREKSLHHPHLREKSRHLNHQVFYTQPSIYSNYLIFDYPLGGNRGRLTSKLTIHAKRSVLCQI